jgi:hypothetical protein
VHVEHADGRERSEQQGVGLVECYGERCGRRHGGGVVDGDVRGGKSGD